MVGELDALDYKEQSKFARDYALGRDHTPVRLDDDSPERSARDILDEIDADVAAIKATKDCL